VIFSHVIYWDSLISGSSNGLQSCAWPSIPGKDPPQFKSWWKCSPCTYQAIWKFFRM